MFSNLFKALVLSFFAQLVTIHYCYGFGSEDLFKKFPNRYFIESGSYIGEGIQQAIRTRCFQVIYSIELSDLYYNNVCELFKNNPQVVLWHGDSGKVLEMVLSSISAPATFWLDAHYSGGETANGATFTPIITELECIRNHFIKTHVILIDDVRLFGPQNLIL